MGITLCVAHACILASSFAVQEEAVRNQNYELAGDLKTEDILSYRGTRALGHGSYKGSRGTWIERLEANLMSYPVLGSSPFGWLPRPAAAGSQLEDEDQEYHQWVQSLSCWWRWWRGGHLPLNWFFEIGALGDVKMLSYSNESWVMSIFCPRC